MPFDFYERLDRAQQATYRRSAAVASISVPDPVALAPTLERLRDALAADAPAEVSRYVTALVGQLTAQLSVAAARVEVLERRPSSETSELHGLYTREDDGRALIQLWMRTAANEKPVAFRTFLRTALHEVLHHLDFELLGLEDTFHTEGFFQRESSLVRQLAGTRRPPPKPTERTVDRAQLELFTPPPGDRTRERTTPRGRRG